MVNRMIKNKTDLRSYLEDDKRALHIDHKYPRPFLDEVWKYEIILRYREYYMNQETGLWNKIFAKLFAFLHHHKGLSWGCKYRLIHATADCTSIIMVY